MIKLIQYITERCLTKTFPSPRKNTKNTVNIIKNTVEEIRNIKDQNFKKAMHGLAKAKLFFDDYKQVFFYICDYLDSLCDEMISTTGGFEVAKIFERIINITSYYDDLKEEFSKSDVIKNLYTTNGNIKLGKQMLDDVLMFWNDICKLSTGKLWMNK